MESENGQSGMFEVFEIARTGL
eukprot:SAG11_NODE_18366_length_493_cov_0.682741_1_plen_21_part_10